MAKKDLDQPVDRFPLAWPAGWPRTPIDQRKRAQFHTIRREERGTPENRYAVTTKRDLTMAGAVERLMRECGRLDADGPVLSTNVELRLDGQPRSDRTMPTESGVALYFRFKNRPIVLACDKWDRVPDNIAAVAGHIEAIRAQDRYGVGRLEQALAGYQRLISGRRAWWEVLEFDKPPVVWAVIEATYLRLAKANHHDLPGNNPELMVAINEAFQTAKQEFGK